MLDLFGGGFDFCGDGVDWHTLTVALARQLPAA
jgi:hypothetical protein